MKTIRIFMFDDRPEHLTLYARLLSPEAKSPEDKYDYAFGAFVTIDAAMHELLERRPPSEGKKFDLALLDWNIADQPRLGTASHTSAALAAECIRKNIPLLIRTSQDGREDEIRYSIALELKRSIKSAEIVDIRTSNREETKFDETLRHEIDAFVDRCEKSGSGEREPV